MQWNQQKGKQVKKNKRQFLTIWRPFTLTTKFDYDESESKLLTRFQF